MQVQVDVHGVLAAKLDCLVNVLQLILAQGQPVIRITPTVIRKRQAHEVEPPLGQERKIALLKRWIASAVLDEFREQIESAPTRQVPGARGFLLGRTQRQRGRRRRRHCKRAGGLEELPAVHGLFSRSNERVIRLACGVAR